MVGIAQPVAQLRRPGRALRVARRRQQDRPAGSSVDLRLGDEVGEPELARGHVAQPQLVEHHLHPHQVAHAGEEREVVERLRQEVVGPGLQPADPLLGRVERGDHDHRDVRGLLARLQRGADREAVHVRHHHVEHHHVGLLATAPSPAPGCRSRRRPRRNRPRTAWRAGGAGWLPRRPQPAPDPTSGNSPFGVLFWPAKPRPDLRPNCVNEWFNGPPTAAGARNEARTRDRDRPGRADLAGRPAGGAGRLPRRERRSRRTTLRGRAADPEFLGFVLDFLLGADAMVLDFAADAGLAPRGRRRGPAPRCPAASCRTGPERLSRPGGRHLSFAPSLFFAVRVSFNLIPAATRRGPRPCQPAWASHRLRPRARRRHDEASAPPPARLAGTARPVVIGCPTARAQPASTGSGKPRLAWKRSRSRHSRPPARPARRARRSTVSQPFTSVSTYS